MTNCAIVACCAWRWASHCWPPPTLPRMPSVRRMPPRLGACAGACCSHGRCARSSTEGDVEKLTAEIAEVAAKTQSSGCEAEPNAIGSVEVAVHSACRTHLAFLGSPGVCADVQPV